MSEDRDESLERLRIAGFDLTLFDDDQLELLAALSRRRKPGAKQHGWAERTLTGMTGG